MKIDLVQAEKLIGLARQSILDFFENKKTEASDEIKSEFSKKTGCFVSLYIGKSLIGCIGYSDPVFPLYKAVIKSAKAAAFEDPRFPPMKKEQMKDLRIELSVLTEPEELEAEKPEDYLNKFNIGVDGLIIKDDFGSGLLLPQVAIEWGWDKEEFLNQTCVKAGLGPECWKDMRRRIYKFQAQVYVEDNGKVIKKNIEEKQGN